MHRTNQPAPGQAQKLDLRVDRAVAGTQNSVARITAAHPDKPGKRFWLASVEHFDAERTNAMADLLASAPALHAALDSLFATVQVLEYSGYFDGLPQQFKDFIARDMKAAGSALALARNP